MKSAATTSTTPRSRLAALVSGFCALPALAMIALNVLLWVGALTSSNHIGIVFISFAACSIALPIVALVGARFLAKRFGADDRVMLTVAPSWIGGVLAFFLGILALGAMTFWGGV